MIRVDGSVGWTRSCAVPVIAHNGDIHEWIGAADDVTTRLAMQDGASSGSVVPQWNAISSVPATVSEVSAPACEAVIRQAIVDWNAHQADPLTLPTAEPEIGSLSVLITRHLVQAGLINAVPTKD